VIRCAREIASSDGGVMALHIQTQSYAWTSTMRSQAPQGSRASIAGIGGRPTLTPPIKRVPDPFAVLLAKGSGTYKPQPTVSIETTRHQALRADQSANPPSSRSRQVPAPTYLSS
jgi:hypothetical protein